MLIPFRKYHGNGNDFVVLDGLDAALPVAQLERAAVQLCDRHRGVGADGLLLVLPPTSPAAQARMRVINADGSEAEMCGNGIRCVAKALSDHRAELQGLGRLLVDTGAGPLTCELSREQGGAVRSVRVEMGRASLAPADLQLDHPADSWIEQQLTVDGRTLRTTAVSMGNPHLITFLDAGADPGPEQLARTLGPQLERHPLFANRTNVEFARPRPDGALELWVWERGCGITQACGTGACATAAAAQVTGRHPAAEPLVVHLPGGPLTIEVAANLSQVWMDGPAQEVFSGELKL